MRTREEIMCLKMPDDAVRKPIVNPNWEHAEILEVLLDIRDLLTRHTCDADQDGLCKTCARNMLV